MVTKMLENLWIRLATAVAAPEEIVKRQEGQALVEYALILVFVSIVGVALLGTIGDKLKGQFTAIINAI
jgi:Flp pilus assembly pilin Flp